jgi:hypothetical protein
MPYFQYLLLMEMQPLQDQNTPMQCAHCKNALDHTDSFCEHCGYPVKGTDEAKSAFHYQANSKQLQLQDTSASIRKAANSLYVVAGVFVVYAIVYYYVKPDSADSLSLLLTNVILAIIFLLLGWWSTRKPVAALISGLSLFIAIQILNMIVDPVTIVQGIILKVFVIFYLIRGLQAAFEASRISKELKGVR